ncbi:uncharacterized protein PGTG_22284 [Puccinia graminis f. sp. tritici CRL 75-36-700-3]|uniref:RRM domain-containing protein n=1 Tax=Puccinia graminis f. sp. tritici (strain CRL 75-36-700-3 / race SCCL) TaxID=418459 RepID=H6QU99_PUCGT|nr:uncharacterized protein PGTG_22284 [Puccinia graminis f. sp. tritici CRL 75-36-700-3]EHS64562.1 hypothetical protein PGTG_22284 [Puccinia graminis f. sp. tritici CRL 75-36-700-3]
MSSPTILYDDPSKYCARYRPDTHSNFIAISNLAPALDQPSKALISFIEPADAAYQAETLNGAIADGRRISIVIIKEAKLGGLALLRRIT